MVIINIRKPLGLGFGNWYGRQHQVCILKEWQIKVLKVIVNLN